MTIQRCLLVAGCGNHGWLGFVRKDGRGATMRYDQVPVCTAHRRGVPSAVRRRGDPERGLSPLMPLDQAILLARLKNSVLRKPMAAKAAATRAARKAAAMAERGEAVPTFAVARIISAQINSGVPDLEPLLEGETPMARLLALVQ